MRIDYNGQSQVLKIEGMRFLHHIVEIAPIELYADDTLIVTWDVHMIAYTDGVQTDTKPFRCGATITNTRKRVRFIELVWRGGDTGDLRVHEEEPEVKI